MQKVQINPELKEALKKAGLDVNVGILYALAVEFDEVDDGLKALMHHSGILTNDVEDRLRVVICNQNYDTGKIENRIPPVVLPGTASRDTLHELLRILTTEYKMKSNGTPNRTHSHSILRVTEKSIEAFDTLKARLGEKFDINKLARIVFSYYNHTEYASNIENYLSASAYIDYFSEQSLISQTEDDDLL